MDQYINPALLFLGAIFGSGGAGALGIKYMLNGSRDAIKRIDTRTEKFAEDMSHVKERVARIEGRISQ